MQLFLISVIVLVVSYVLARVDYATTNKKNRRIIEENRHAYRSTIIIADIFLIGGIYVILRNGFYSRIKPIITSQEYLWCLASSLIGFSLAVSQKRFDGVLLYLQCFIFYTFPLLLITTLVFSILALNNLANNYLLSFSLCATLSFLVDRYWSLFIEKAKNLKKNESNL